MQNFNLLDIILIFSYLIFTLLFGLWIGRHQKDTNDYFLGGRSIPWFAVMLSIVATETSVLTFISIPAVSFSGDLRFIQIVLGFMLGRFIVAYGLIPGFFKGRFNTAYNLIGERFGQKMRSITSGTFMLTRLLADGVRTFATAIPVTLILKHMTGLNLSDNLFYIISILIIGIMTIIYTYVGGIRSVIYLDMIQWFIYMSGAVLTVILILNSLPAGFDWLEAAKLEQKLKWFQSGASLSFSEFIKEPYTFFTALISGAVFSVASHGTDQIIVQRLLTTKGVGQARKAMIGSGISIFIQFGLFLWIGVLLFVFYGSKTAAELGLNRSDEIFPKFIIENIPAGFSGLLIAALIAAAMSTLSSSLSSMAGSTVFDIYKPVWGKNKSEKEMFVLSRRITMIWGIILIGSALLFISLQGTVVELALGIASYTYGSLLGIFVFSFLFKKANQTDAVFGFISSIVLMAVFKTVFQIAWPLYTIIGVLILLSAGYVSLRIRLLRLASKSE